MKLFSKQMFMVACLLVLGACNKSTVTPTPQPVKKSVLALATATQSTQQILSETFDNGSKTAYAIGNVSLTSGSWSMNDALIGSDGSDAKNGVKSVRVRSLGSLSMNFNVAVTGTTTITVNHGVYGSDASSTWQLFVSANDGSTYTQLGSTITSSSTTLQSASFQTTQTGNIRLSIRKASGGSNRINIDDVVINSGTTTPTDEDTTTTGNTSGTTTTATDDDNMLLGNPSGAVANISSPNNYLMDKTYYTICYNKAAAKANWVSWHVEKSDIGTAERQDNFRQDAALPSSWDKVGSGSYSGSGFDRGHYCPSGDRTSSETANSATFLMTNMMPQAPTNNQQTWNNLEGYTRDLVAAGKEVYVIDGSYGQGGTGDNGTVNTISKDNINIVVPSNVWKIIVVLDDGNNDLSRITKTTRVIAVNTPNINSIDKDWKKYKVSVSDIEKATGYTFFTNVSSSISASLKTVVDNQ